jgi:predicted small lipoprotein YifL
MRRLVPVLTLSLVVSTLAACGRGPSREPESAALAISAAAPAASFAKRRAAPEQAQAEQAAADSAAETRRYVAVRHTLQIFTAADGVEAAWRDATAACVAAGCEVLNAALERNDERRPATATLEARVPPERLEAFLARMSSLGRTGLNARTAEDKTDTVLDTEARLKNQTTFRDHLRALMSTPGAKLKDLIEVERELVQVQSELDSLASQRKVLANETDKVHVSISFRAQPSVIQTGMWEPVTDALRGAGHVVAMSVGVLITAAVGLLPWVVALGLAGWGVRALWRRRARRHG